MPTNTDLVTDLPADFEVFGQAVDTSLADLKGGTTGQILAKATNADMDFTWVANDVGDITAVTAGTGITGGGTSGAVTVSFDQANFGGGQNAAGKNTVINGGMDIWQRGTSIAGTTTSFSADRWQSYRGVAGSTFSRQAGPEAIQYCIRVQRDSGNTSTTGIFLAQNFETVNSIPLAGKTVTLSFYARAGANYSRVSNGLTVSLFTGTGTDQNGLTGAYTGSVTAITQTATLTTSWQRFSYSATLSTTATEINTTFSFTPVGTAGAADYYEITGVQVEAAATASPFQRNASTIQGELAACQRYYFQAPTNMTASGYIFSTSGAYGTFNFPVTMRVQPSASYSATGWSINAAAGAGITTAVSTLAMSTQAAFIQFTKGATMTVGQGHLTNSTDGLSSFSAEL